MSSDKILLPGIKCQLYVGVETPERNHKQDFEIDLEIRLDLREAGKKDDLTKTINYAAMIQTVLEHLEARRFVLIERVAEEAAGLVLKNALADKVTVRIKKMNPQMRTALAYAGVEITRSKESEVKQASPPPAT